MFTRCQACHTVHPLNAALLAQGGGKYRCAKCQKTGNALDTLFDSWPDASEQGPAPGNIPELGAALKLDSIDDPSTSTDDADDSEPLFDDKSGSEFGWMMQRAAWVTWGMALTAIISVSLIGFFQPSMIEQSWLKPVMSKLGLESKATQAPLRSIDDILMVSRELIPHPERPDMLQLNTTIVNKATYAQVYPQIDVILLDIDNQRLARHLFQPKDYLSRSSQFRSGMIPEAHLTVSLNIPDPGARAVGFELQFH
jgi:predicted Zn finger-like uncharacterized protein